MWPEYDYECWDLFYLIFEASKYNTGQQTHQEAGSSSRGYPRNKEPLPTSYLMSSYLTAVHFC